MKIVKTKESRIALISNYINLAKPRTILPHFITATAAMFLAGEGLPAAHILWFTLLGGGLTAAGANTLNSYLDRDIDALMMRTRHRPLPSGLVSRGEALVFGAVTGLAGVVILSVFVNWAAALLAVIALVYYIVPYTLLLKRRTYWGTIIGSITGAIPPLIGWAAVGGQIQLTPFMLSVIIILWTVPHFWALALFRRDEYSRAGISILPENGVFAWIVTSSFLLVSISLILVKVSGLGIPYLATACIAGAVFLFLALRLKLRETQKLAILFYRYTIFYVSVLFLAMIIDSLL